MKFGLPILAGVVAGFVGAYLLLAIFGGVAHAGTDNFAGYRAGLADPATDAFTITPDDGNDLTYYPRALLLGAEGTVKVTTIDGTAISLPLVQGFNSIRVKRVWSTGTDAGVISAGIYGLQ